LKDRTWLEAILVARGIAVTDAGLIGGIIIVGGIFGSIVIPGISDKAMRRKPFIIFDIIALLLCLLLRETVHK